jgi:hypothetical protein
MTSIRNPFGLRTARAGALVAFVFGLSSSVAAYGADVAEGPGAGSALPTDGMPPGDGAQPPADPGMDDAGMADPAAPAPGTNPVAKATEAAGEVEKLKKYLKDSKADNGDIIASIETVAKALKELRPADKEAEKALDPAVKAFLKEGEDELLRAFVLKKVKANTETNLRDDVNVAAAKALASARPDVTEDVKQRLETIVFKAKDYVPPTSLYDEAFRTIGLLNNHKAGLAYCQDWIKYDNSPGRPDRIKAAFDALILFKDVKPETKLEIVKKTLTTFVGVEHAAAINKSKEEQAQKAVWEKVKPAVIKALQHYCGEPKDAEGKQLNTVQMFNEWFKSHDNVRREPWTEAKAPSK